MFNISLDTSDLNQFARRKKFFSNVLKHLFYMISLSFLSCCIGIYLCIYYFNFWVSLIIFSFLSLIIISITNWFFLSTSKREFVFFKTISFLIGFLISPTVLAVNIKIIVSALILTTILFFLLFLVSKTVSEERADFFGALAIKIFIIHFILFIISLFLISFNFDSIFVIRKIDIFVSFLVSIGFIFATIYDFKKISILSKQILADNEEDYDFAVKYCAYRLYIDYSHFFHKILKILIYFYGRKKK